MRERHRRHGLAGGACVVAIAIATIAWGADGSVTGTVRLEGTPPERPAVPVFKHQEVCGTTVPDDRLVVGANGGLRWAIVTIDGVRGGRKPERDTTVTLDNRRCRFVPHVQVAEVGQWLDIHNEDPILHDADARIGAETLFNVAVRPDHHVRKPLARSGRVAVTCDVRHTWMSAVVDVTEHPYHTVTDAEGVYEIRDVPPGTYTLRVWHEELGSLERPLKVEPGASATVDVAYPAPKRKEGGQ